MTEKRSRFELELEAAKGRVNERGRGPTGELAVCMLDVGQGDSTLIALPDDRVVVFDCADDQVLRQNLLDLGLKEIVAFVLSHLDQDHIAGALAFLREFDGEIHRVYLSADRDISDSHEEARRAKALVDHIREQSKDTPTRGRRWELVPSVRHPCAIAEGDGWAVRLIAPPHSQTMDREREGTWEDPNRYSSILRIEAGGNVMLVGGDAPLLSWSQLPAEELPAKIFRIPHHGGAIDDGGRPDGWDEARLYREVGAETALISVGTNNAHGHPRRESIRPITGGACRLVCTQVTARCHGSLEVTRADETVVRDLKEITSLRRHVITQHHQWTLPQYRHLTEERREIRAGQLEVPCAGTVIVRLHLDGRIGVLPATHGRYDELVDGWEQPLCRAF